MLIGMGIDLIEIERIQRSIKHYGNRFLNRIFTPQEQDYCLKKKNPFPHFSGKFSVKEAFFKAFNPLNPEFSLSWLDLSVKNMVNGSPILIFEERLQKEIEFLAISRTHFSLSHSRTMAISTVFLER